MLVRDLAITFYPVKKIKIHMKSRIIFKKQTEYNHFITSNNVKNAGADGGPCYCVGGIQHIFY
jgi:hypothetical protein